MNARHHWRSRGRRGVTIVEAAIATAIVGGILVAAMNGVAASRTLRGRNADRVRAEQLALDLMSEILQQAFQDPGTPGTSRSGWSFVDDYNGLVDSPPQTKGGTPIPDSAGWSRNVSVQWVDPTTFGPTSATNTGVRRINVNVTRGGFLLGSASAYRTSGWPDLISYAVDATGNHAPLAVATASPLTGKGGQLTVTCNGTASSDPDGDALTCAWTFGDGATAKGAVATHTYTAAGTYTATLTVADGRGGVGVAAVNVVVSP